MPMLISGGLVMLGGHSRLGADPARGVKQPAQPLRTAIEVEIVPKARQRTRRPYPRLSRVNLPGVNVEDELLLPQIQPAQRPTREPIWKQAEITTACDRDLDPAVTENGNREFHKAATARRGQDVRPGLGVGNPVAVVAHREYARIVLEPFLAEDVERPERTAGDRVSRRAVSHDRLLAQILQQRLRLMRLAAEFRRRLCVDQPVAHSVRCDFVTSRSELAHDLRVFAGHPAEHEECRTNFALGEHFEERRRARAYARAKSVPRAPVDDSCKALDLEVVLDVYCKGISHAASVL